MDTTGERVDMFGVHVRTCILLPRRHVEYRSIIIIISINIFPRGCRDFLRTAGSRPILETRTATMAIIILSAMVRRSLANVRFLHYVIFKLHVQIFLHVHFSFSFVLGDTVSIRACTCYAYITHTHIHTRARACTHTRILAYICCIRVHVHAHATLTTR